MTKGRGRIFDIGYYEFLHHSRRNRQNILGQKGFTRRKEVTKVTGVEIQALKRAEKHQAHIHALHWLVNTLNSKY
jgi:hypothetical protein